MNKTIVVGDRFKDFADKHDNVITLRNLISMENESTMPSLIICGQGVDKALIQNICSKNNLQPVDSVLSYLPKATSEAVHKHNNSNITVSAPVKISNNLFRLNVSFSNDNEFFLDHMSGQHIQGMAITEAFRQAFLCVTETFHLSNQENHYFVIHNMNVAYQKFLFPIEASITYTINELKISDKKVFSSISLILNQVGHPCATAEISFSAFKSEFIQEKEHGLAQEVITKYIENFEENKNQLDRA